MPEPSSVVLHQEGVQGEGNLEMLSDDEDDGAFLIFESKGRAMYNMELRGYFTCCLLLF